MGYLHISPTPALSALRSKGPDTAASVTPDIFLALYRQRGVHLRVEHWVLRRR